MVNKRSFGVLPLENNYEERNNENQIRNSPSDFTLRRSLGKVPMVTRKAGNKEIIINGEEEFITTKKLLGQGAYSKVYLGYHSKSLQKVAIKIVNTKKLSAISKMKLQKEIEILKKLKQHASENFVKLYKVYNRKDVNNNEKIYLAMEYLPGCELFEFCASHPTGVPEKLAKSIIKKILEAIKELHELQICHLDLKLENIIYHSDTQSVKIIDFGFSQFTSASGESQTQSEVEPPQLLQNTFCGSVHYAAPELLKKKAFDGKKADVWSLGVLFFALFAGYFPYDDENTKNIFSMIKYTAVNYPSFFSNQQRDFLSLMLKKEPVNRWSIKDLLSHPYLLM